MKTISPVPYMDCASQTAAIKPKLLNAMSEVLDSGSFILGKHLQEFEQQFAAFCGTAFAIGVNSGTDALHLVLKGLGVGPGDEVITVPNSFITTSSAIALVGARPVFVDVGEDCNINPSLLEEAITSRTKVVLPVHLTGRPANMERLASITEEYGLKIVEDCAQAVGAEYGGRRVGSFGVAGCFSLHPLKTLGACGDAGIITTDDPDLYERLIVMRNGGLQGRNTCEVWSTNSRLDELQAAILLVKMQCVEDWTEKRRRNARVYQQTLQNLPDLVVPSDQPYERAVYHTFVVQTENRDGLQQFLAQKKIGSAVHYPIPIHLQPAAMSLSYGPGSFPVAERQARSILSLPIHQGLECEEITHVANCIREFYRKDSTQ